MSQSRKKTPHSAPAPKSEFGKIGLIQGVPPQVSAGPRLPGLVPGEKLYDTAFHKNPALQSVVRASDGVIVEVNDTFLRKMSRTREMVIGKTPFDLGSWVNPEKLHEVRRVLETKGFIEGYETQLRATTGEVFSVLLFVHPVQIEGQLYFISAGVDITKQKKAEQALRDAEAQTRALYESISAAVVVHDQTGFRQINSASLKLFGTSRPDQILGKQPTDFSAPKQPDGEDSAVAARRHMDRALAEGAHRFEWLARRLDGTDVPVEVTLTSVHFQGQPALQAVVIDLTERKRAEAELQNALAKERELSQLKSDFVSVVSHEFRTPLEIIMSAADNLQRYHDRLPPEKRGQLLQTINRSVRRMSTMMEEVLVLGRLEKDRMTFNPAAFDVRASCQRICDEIESATSKRCPVNLQLPPELAGAQGDESVFRHIFTNLLSNAVKYSPHGQPVEFTLERDGGNALCRITDHGCGIPAADQKRLFQAFHRGSNVRQIPGTGLGLLIVQRCVNLHGGDISFESAEGKGTTFTVRLPLFPRAPARTPGSQKRKARARAAA